MKIENIIDDIKNDIMVLGDKLEERFKTVYPHLNFNISLPEIEALATIKSIALSIEEDDTVYCFSIDVHTHNGNRVFENAARQIINNQPVAIGTRHPIQDDFVHSVRDIIKKNKSKGRAGARCS